MEFIASTAEATWARAFELGQIANDVGASRQTDGPLRAARIKWTLLPLGASASSGSSPGRTRPRTFGGLYRGMQAVDM